MKYVLYILLTVLGISCSTIGRQSSKPVLLPKITFAEVDWDDGLTALEAHRLASFYFRQFVSTCGMTDKPQDDGSFWSVQLWGGYAGTDYGRMLFAKDGSKAFLEPPKGGFSSEERERLARQCLSYEQQHRVK